MHAQRSPSKSGWLARASVARAENSATSSKGGGVTSRLQRKPGNLFVEERVARLHSCIYLLSVPVGDPVLGEV